MERCRQGFALVVSLLVLVVVVSLGVGAVFLSTMNLRVAENTRAHAIAAANAESGLDVALVSLRLAYESASPKQFPSTFGDADVVAHDLPGVVFVVAEYEAFTETLARVAVRGFGPRDAEYVTEALIGSPVGDPDPIFSFGLISEKGISIAGASGTLIDAGAASNDGIWTPGWGPAQFTYCTAPRDPITMQCPPEARQQYPASEEPLMVWEGHTTCSPPGNPFCEAGRVKSVYWVPERFVVNPEYIERRHRAAGGTTETVDVDGVDTVVLNDDGAITPSGELNLAGCDGTTTVCHSNFTEVVVDASEVSGKRIIANGPIRVTCAGDADCSLDNTILISLTGSVNVGSVTDAFNVRIFSQESVSAGGQWRGSSTIASAENVNLTGTQQMFLVDNRVTVAIIAGNNINVTGGGGTATPAVFIAGGALNWAGGGGTYIVGGVLVKDGVNIAGGFTIDAGADIDNIDLGGLRGDPQIFSRR